MRITRPLTKTIYVFGGYAVLVLVARLTNPMPPFAYAIVDFAVIFAYVGFGVRTFRGKFEPVEPPRPWWRMTGRPKAGFWIAGLELFGAASTALRHGADFEMWPLYLVEATLIGLFYLNSSIQLVRRRVTSVETTPRDLAVPRAYRVKP